ncbi:MAG TPA: DNA polymerase II large subunit [Candidatus Korarchaeota archaeon]|nr:DNA polymerase II large subunit [Candidatus Korarchaeota archaeon]
MKRAFEQLITSNGVYGGGMELDAYFLELEKKVAELYEVAQRARSVGLDPSPNVEVARGDTLPQRLVALFNRPDLAEMTEKYLRQGLGKVEIAFKVAEEILSSRSGTQEELAELAVRVGMAIMTDATVSAPIEGINSVRIKVNPRDGSCYLAVYYNGPIRTAGGTEGALSVVLADFVRQKLGLDRYKPTDAEVERYAEEVELYKRAVHLQYNSTPEEVKFVARNLVVEVTGPPTEQVEVSTNRDLPTVETNRVRGGAVLVLNDCLLQKRKKLAKIIPKLREVVGFDDSGWAWLGGHAEEEANHEEALSGCPYVEPSYKYLRDSVVGRPVLSHPSAVGGFRLRYGHARNTGLASVGVHPATMVILDEFLAVGTQVRIERPGKSAVVMPVDSIEGPIVRLRDGSVVRVEDVETARAIQDQVDRVLFLGDILIGFGEFLENNHILLPSSWVEEWWHAWIVEEARKKGYRLPLHIEENPFVRVDFDTAAQLSLALGVPLHPRWTYFWHDITVDDLRVLLEALRNSKVKEKFIPIQWDERVKEVLERLGVPHRVEEDLIIVSGDDAKALQATLLAKEDLPDLSQYGPHEVMRAVNDLSPFRIMPKAPYYVGMRLGRPEKAKPRKMKPPVNVLFPIGRQKGMSRSLKTALQRGRASVEVALRRCPKCGRETVHYLCPECGVRTQPQPFCPRCGRRLREGQKCPDHPRDEPVPYRATELNIREIAGEAVDRLGGGLPLDGVKCVQGLTSKSKSPEPLEKGILRASKELFVFKDGTVRFDVTNAALTHFTPREVGVPVEKLRELGYETDAFGRPLVSEDQLLELKVQDVIIPVKAAEYLFRVSKFIDELLMRFYGLPPYYNLESPEDLVGHILFTISPHTFVANAVRVVGFTEADVILAHPYLHAAKRRNVDGDEDSLMLGLDCLLNFSKSYLPYKPGGREDAPLILVTRLDLGYIDDECYNIEVVWRYPREFYEATLRYAHPQELEGSVIQTVGTAYASGERYPSIGFTHPTSHCWRGPLTTMYRRLNTMLEKLDKHIALEEKLAAVDAEDALVRAMSAHFLRDIAGNLRKYASQKFRCSKCNKKFRRPPLLGRCPACGGNITLTIHPRSAVKYLEPTKEILKRYRLGGYLLQRVELLEMEAASLFSLGENTESKHSDLSEFVSDEPVVLSAEGREEEEGEGSGLAAFL